MEKHTGAQVTVNRAAADAARRGHPWIWKRAIVRLEGAPGVGGDVQVLAEDGDAIGRGIFDPASPIAVRMWTRGRAPIDPELVRARIAGSFALRTALFGDGATNAYRLLHGEGDRVPGFVLDRYSDVAVLRLDGGGAEAQANGFVDLLRAPLEGIGVRTLVRRSSEKGAPRTAETLIGPDPPDKIEVREHGVPFVVDLLRGQKTGAFLDQRENRRRVGAMVRKGTRVLNLFSYAGGFSLHAALAGAEVTSVDVAAAAHATAQSSFRLAGVDPKGHTFASADCFAYLEAAKKRGQTWDLVVSDPPSFAPSEKALPRALAAYRTLHRACVEVLAAGGTFCAASCSSHVDANDFLGTLDDGALGRSDLRLLELHGPPPDHPTLAAWPEGRYLKFAVLA